MIDAIKSLGELLIKLASESEASRQKIISEVIDPMYSTAMRIMTKYRHLVEMALTAAQSADRAKISACGRKMQKIRLAYRAERESVVAMAQTARDKWKKDSLRNFAEEVGFAFFKDPRGPLSGGPGSIGENATTHSWLTTLAEVLRNPLGEIWIQPKDYRDVTQGTRFYNERPTREFAYRHQPEREAFVEAKIKKLRLLAE